MARRPPERTALDAYMEHHRASLALLDRIRETIVNHDDAPGDGTIHWGHVGDAAWVHARLQEISDSIHHEGEHAE